MSAGDRVRAMHRGALCINDVGRMKSERERERERGRCIGRSTAGRRITHFSRLRDEAVCYRPRTR